MTRNDRWRRAAGFAAAAILLGQALQVSDGRYDPTALFWVGLALAASAAAILGLIPRWLGASEKPTLAILGLGLGLQIFELLAWAAEDAGPRPSADVAWFLRGLAGVALIAGFGFTRRSWRFHVTLPALFVLHLMLGAWMIARVPHPGIDVFMVQQAASQDVLAGKNPYVTVYPDIYGGRSPFYAPGMSVDGRLTFGFAYPPLSLFLAVPGYALAHDVRYALLVALILAAAAIAYARGSRIGALAAALLLFTPRTFFVLREAWTEPFVLMLLGTTLLLACRKPAGVPWGLGLLFAIKPYTLGVAPLAWLLTPRRVAYARLLSAAAVVALLVTLPLAWRDFPAFYRSTIGTQLEFWPRVDSLSFNTLWARSTGHFLPGWTAFLLAGAATAVSLWRSPRTAAGFAGSVGFAFLVLFAGASRAFCNYYFFVIGALCGAVGATETD